MICDMSKITSSIEYYVCCVVVCVMAWYGLRYDNKREWLQDVEVWEMMIKGNGNGIGIKIDMV